MPKDLILACPLKLSFLPYPIAALKEPQLVLNNFLLNRDLLVSLSMMIVDDQEQKPLLKDRSASHSLMLMGEMIEGIYETMEAHSWRLIAIEPDVSKESLVIDFVVPSGFFAGRLIGSAMCFMVALDALLFVRGLRARDMGIKIADEQSLSYPEFFATFIDIMTKIHDEL